MTDAAFVSIVDRSVRRLLEQSGVSHPPIDAIQLARRLGIEVVLDARQQPRGRQTRIAGRTSIFIRPDDRPERRQWAVAHELGESIAHELFHTTGLELLEIEPRLRERAANLAAGRLLLPADWFPPDAVRFDGDLPSLKSRYETASHELIAFRLLDLPQPAVVTVFDQGRQTRRQGNGRSGAPPLDRLEQECWLAVHRFHRPHELTESGRRVRGWPIHEPQWRREILRTTWETGGE